jgi:metal-responsive CopG/Arc/MetJ family transcriptional regulator
MRLPKQLVSTIDKIAKDTATSRAEVVRQLLTEALEARNTKP